MASQARPGFSEREQTVLAKARALGIPVEGSIKLARMGASDSQIQAAADAWASARASDAAAEPSYERWAGKHLKEIYTRMNLPGPASEGD